MLHIESTCTLERFSGKDIASLLQNMLSEVLWATEFMGFLIPGCEKRHSNLKTLGLGGKDVLHGHHSLRRQTQI
jgi:hypothetical protein